MPATYLTNPSAEQMIRANSLDHVRWTAERADEAHRKGIRTREQRALSALQVAVGEVEAYVSTETE